MTVDHCNGCGRPGTPVSREPSFATIEESPGDLFLTPASVWPDGRARHVCRKCDAKLDRKLRRLIKAATGWGHMT
jgi:hypothetical protein